MFREHNLLGPFERVGFGVIGSNEGINALADLLGAGETCPGQGLADQDTEPDLDLIEPRAVGRREMKVDVLMPCQPAILLGLVSVEVIEDDVQLLAGIVGQQSS